MHPPLLTTTQLGQLILSARKAKGLSQSELAARMGLSQGRISQFELKPETITAQQLLLLTSVLGLEISIGSRATSTPGVKTNELDW
ncbi:MAG: helix-turn-helix transcriptional regulator [Comamonadaceae bacterium]